MENMTTQLETQLTNEQKMAMNVLSLNTAVNDLQEDVKTLNRVVIVGNGELPLREQVRNISAVVNEWKGWIKFFVALLITQALTVIGGIVVAYIKFLPLLEKLADGK